MQQPLPMFMHLLNQDIYYDYYRGLISLYIIPILIGLSFIQLLIMYVARPLEFQSRIYKGVVQPNLNPNLVYSKIYLCMGLNSQDRQVANCCFRVELISLQLSNPTSCCRESYCFVVDKISICQLSLILRWHQFIVRYIPN